MGIAFASPSGLAGEPSLLTQKFVPSEKHASSPWVPTLAFGAAGLHSVHDHGCDDRGCCGYCGGSDIRVSRVQERYERVGGARCGNRIKVIGCIITTFIRAQPVGIEGIATGLPVIAAPVVLLRTISLFTSPTKRVCPTTSSRRDRKHRYSP